MKLYSLRYSQLQHILYVPTRFLSQSVSTGAKAKAKCKTDASDHPAKDGEAAKIKERKKTIAQLDEEIRMKLEGCSGDGGVAGLELENGKPVAM